MDVNAIRVLAEAILYEGYLLYPYRRSALKNRSQGWTFGTLLPEPYAVSQQGESCGFHAEMLVQGKDPGITVELRFLHLSTAEPLERTVSAAPLSLQDLMSSPMRQHFVFPAGKDTRSVCEPIAGTLCISADLVGDSVFKVSVTAMNCSTLFVPCDTRDHALRQSMVSAHALAAIAGGQFISLLDPPAELHALAAGCKQEGVFPVLAGLEGSQSAMLISPIILYDYPQVAAKSSGDFFDSTEIDEMLTLRVMTLSDAEKSEIRAAGDYGRAVLDRTESLSPKQILDLHGFVHKERS